MEKKKVLKQAVLFLHGEDSRKLDVHLCRAVDIFPMQKQINTDYSSLWC